MVFILGTIPELILASYLQDIWKKDFIESVIQIYLILAVIWLIRFIIGEISFRLFIKRTMIENIYSILVKEKFPNPWNYYIDDGITYFQEVWLDLNNELLDAKVINWATAIYTQVKTFYDLNQFWNYWRFKNVLWIAVKRFMDENFETSINDLNLSSENLIEILNKYDFPKASELKTKDPLKYLEWVIGASNDYDFGKKIAAIRIRNSINQKHLAILKNEYDYDIDQSTERSQLETLINNLSEALEIWQLTIKIWWNSFAPKKK